MKTPGPQSVQLSPECDFKKVSFYPARPVNYPLMSDHKAVNLHTSRWLLWSAGILVVVASFAADDVVDDFFRVPAHGISWQFAEWVSKLGDWPPILVVGLAWLAALACCRKLASGRLWLVILAAGLLTGFASTVVRSTVGRTRPLAAAPQGFYGLRYEGKWIVGKYEFSSFPSGHTATWAGLAGAAWSRRRRAAGAFMAGAALVGWSRMALGCHHFSDVMASVVFGMAVGGWLCRRFSVIFQENCERKYDAATSA